MTLKCHNVRWIIHTVEVGRPSSCRRGGFPASLRGIPRSGSGQVPWAETPRLCPQITAYSRCRARHPDRDRVAQGLHFRRPYPTISGIHKSGAHARIPGSPWGGESMRKRSGTAWRLALSTIASLAVLPDLFRPYTRLAGVLFPSRRSRTNRRFSWASLR